MPFPPKAQYGGALLVLAAFFATPVSAHGFGQRYDLPLPLSFWLVGAGATVIISFAAMAMFYRERPGDGAYPRFNLLRLAPIRWLAHPVFVALIRAVSVAAFVGALYAGGTGIQVDDANILIVLVWVIWWVGFAFTCALVGNLWALVNPIRTVFVWAESLFAWVTGGASLSLKLAYPTWLQTWPGVVIFLGFAWAELVWADSGVPASLATAILAYSVATWIGMFVWGGDVWLRHGEVFSIAFGILARFAPLDVPATEPGEDRQFNLRPPGAGLAADRAVTFSLLVFVIVMLSTVTFDGYLETSMFRASTLALYTSPSLAGFTTKILNAGVPLQAIILTTQMLLFPVVFAGAFWATSWAMVRVAARKASGAQPVTVYQVAMAFVLTLVPIAVAYHLSHYVSLLVITGQLIVPLISDPMGLGWDLFGTADYRLNIGLVSAGAVWYFSVTAIVVGHAIAVFLSHSVAVRIFGNREAALASQIPMVGLMVAYTMLSLWIVAQPIVG